MEYSEFLADYGGAVRTKHIYPPNKGGPAVIAANKRPHALPTETKLPREFIRLDPWEAEYLFLVSERSKEGMVETGRFHGGSTFLMACANPLVPIWSIDISPQDDVGLYEKFRSANIGQNVDLIVGDSQKKRYQQIKKFDVLFVDGDHSYEGCFSDLENWYPLLSPGGHVVVHDCYNGQPVMDATTNFFFGKNVQTIVPSFRTSNHWWHHAGSIAHYVKQ